MSGLERIANRLGLLGTLGTLARGVSCQLATWPPGPSEPFTRVWPTWPPGVFVVLVMSSWSIISLCTHRGSNANDYHPLWSDSSKSRSDFFSETFSDILGHIYKVLFINKSK